MPSLIDMQDITKIYKMGDNIVYALKGINIQIENSEFVAIMGASGSGKSTLMNIIGILDRPSSGTYYLDGKEVSSLTEDEQAIIRNQHVGFVFQSFFLLNRFSAIQNVSLPLRYRNMRAKDIKERAEHMLERVGLKDLMNHRPNQLSGGQQQRVAVARALVGEPSLILADEPTGALDSRTSKEVMELFTELNEAEKTTIIIITHDSTVGEQCKRMIRIKDGLVVSE